MADGYYFKFFTSSEAAWEGMLDSCRKATKTIDLEQFAFGNDGTVIEAFQAVFIKKAREGVRVRLLLDAVGSFGFYRSFRAWDLQKQGIEVVFHRGILFPSLKRLIPLILRDHRKLLVVDGEEIHIGGVIIEERARNWRDTAVVLRGAVVSDFQKAFNIAWKRSRNMDPVGRVISKGEAEFSMAGNSFHLHHKDLYREFLRHITAAKKYVYITTPYFLPHREFRRALYFARDKGVDVRILLPKQSDNFIADFVGRRYYERLTRHGIRIFLYVPEVLHGKTMVIDDNWATVGSCNFDWLSFWVNYELNVLSTNQAFATELREIFLRDLEQSEEVTRETKI